MWFALNYNFSVDKEFTTKQKHILELLWHVDQDTKSKDHWDIIKTFELEAHVAEFQVITIFLGTIKHIFRNYKVFSVKAFIISNFPIHNNNVSFLKQNPAVVKKFVNMYKQGMLPRDRIFSVFDHHHLEQSIALFKVFYSAKTYDTFYKTAVWARHHVNQGQYVYALSVAVLHRPEFTGVMLPPIYEVYPHYFFNTEVIAEAQKMKQIHSAEHQPTSSVGEYNGNN